MIDAEYAPAVDALAVYRLTRLVTRDSLTAPVRGWVARTAYASQGRVAATAKDWTLTEWSAVPAQDHIAPRLATLVTCPWCFSVWVAFGVVGARRYVPRLWAPIARALALSAVAGLTARAADGAH